MLKENDLQKALSVLPSDYLVIGEARGEEAYEIMMSFTKPVTGEGVSEKGPKVFNQEQTL